MATSTISLLGWSGSWKAVRGDLLPMAFRDRRLPSREPRCVASVPSRPQTSASGPWWQLVEVPASESGALLNDCVQTEGCVPCVDYATGRQPIKSKHPYCLICRPMEERSLRCGNGNRFVYNRELQWNTASSRGL
jgi:hypothetical protein